MPAGSILVADDDTAIRTVLNQALSRAGYEVRLTGNAATLWRWVSQGEGDLVITDVVMPDENAFDLLPRIKKMRPNLPVIVMSAQNTFMTAIRASERGAYEYLPKPFDLKELITIVGRALAEPKERVANSADEAEFDSIPLVGRSPAMQEIYRVLARLMQTDLTVMISGESGTGKELVARALHDYGKRRNGPFVAVNMAAIPRDLIESELFGHERGAFTGANTRASGRFEQAEGGTLFLDEIGDMPMEAQTRLLRVLQQGEYTTVGGRTPIKTDVRIVAASNKDLRILIQQGLFREDLFFRLNVVPLRLPPLRERIEDLPDLIRHFFSLAEKDGLPPKKLDTLALERLKQHRWPGNVRELENLARRLAALYPQDVITGSVIDGELAPPAVASGGNAPLGVENLGGAVEAYLSSHFSGFPNGVPPPGLYHRILKEIEVPLLTAALAATRGNQIRAADLLGPQPQYAAQEDPGPRHSGLSERRLRACGARSRATKWAFCWGLIAFAVGCAAELSQFGNMCDMNASVRDRRTQRPFSSPIAGMTTAETSAPPFDPSLAESTGGIPAEVGGAVCGRHRAAVGVPDLHGAERPDADRADPPRRLFIPADQRGDHPAAGRDHRPRSLAGDSGPAARQGGGTAARPDCRPVLRHRRVAGGAGGDRGQRDHRPRPRPAVLRSDPRGDAELADRRPRLHLRTRAADPRRHPGNGQRHCPRPAAVRPGSAVVSRTADPERCLPQFAGGDADRQGSQHSVGSTDRHQTGIHDAAAGFSQQRE